jgi:hypothetical protein
LAFFVLAANRIGIGLTADGGASGDRHYWVRLAAFALIFVAILDKNRPSASRTGSNVRADQ